MPKGEGKLTAQSKRTRHDYSIIDTMGTGVALQGTEIRSIRNGRINLRDEFTRVHNGEIFLHNVHIGSYEQGNIFNHGPLCTRELSLHKKQIIRLENELKNTGITAVPLKVYIHSGYARVLTGLARGKRSYDKRKDLKRKDIDR